VEKEGYRPTALGTAKSLFKLDDRSRRDAEEAFTTGQPPATVVSNFTMILLQMTFRKYYATV
jgi:hypothetical protein